MVLGWARRHATCLRGWARRTGASAAEGTTSPPTVPFRVERRNVAIADLDPDALRALVAELDTRADEVGCVVFDGTTGTGLTFVVFAGNLERFAMLSVVRHLSCRVVFVQDVKSWWYQGSDVLPDLDRFCRTFLVGEIGSDRSVFFGQSSGAYAALVASTYLPGATVLACAPQTFSDGSAKAGIHFVGIRPLSAPAGLVDVEALLARKPDPAAFRAVIIAAGEVGNPADQHYWMDYLHALRLARSPGLDLFVMNANNHAVVHRNVPIFARLLSVLANDIGAARPQKVRVVAAALAEAVDRDAAERGK